MLDCLIQLLIDIDVCNLDGVQVILAVWATEVQLPNWCVLHV